MAVRDILSDVRWKKVKSEKTSYFAPNQYIRLQDKYIGGDVVSGGQCQESCQIGGVAANVFVIVFVFVSVFVFVIVFLLVRLQDAYIRGDVFSGQC